MDWRPIQWTAQVLQKRELYIKTKILQGNRDG